MSKDRLVQIVALLLAVGCLIGTTTLAPYIRDQREELNLTFTFDRDQGQPPKYALTAAAMGSFRGLVVDVLWYRIEHLKQAGKIHEANTLAEWITTLQPRFAQVWVFQAWNMAYNISVMTHTPEERWMWVQKGINLLRNEGIPNNPGTVSLYDQLGWIFYHKVGQYLDDHHWYYKEQLAREWHILLGSQRQTHTPEQVIDQFEDVAAAADAYFQLGEPSRTARQKVNALREAHPDLAETLDEIWSENLTRFREKLSAAIERLRARNQREVVQELETLLEEAQQRRDRSRHAPLTLLQQDVPETTPIIEQWRSLGLNLDITGLRRFGELKMYADRVPPSELIASNAEFISESDASILRFIDEHQNSDALMEVLAFLRARMLIEDYKMRPRYMYELMEKYGPLDWRHHASHALYWYLLGTRRGDLAGNVDRFALLRAHRQSRNSLQNLVFQGQINYDPFARTLNYSPDPGYFAAYEELTEELIQRVTEDERYSGSVVGFETGHENLLQKLSLFSYLYGDEEQARAYYTKARRLYADKPWGHGIEVYSQPLDDFIAHVLARDQGMMQVSPAFIEAMIERGLREGLAQGRRQVFNKFLDLARQMHRQWQQTRGWEQPGTVRGGRMMLEPFNQVLVDIYADFMSQADVSIYQRVQIYRNTPASLQRRAYPEFRAAVQSQAEQYGFDASVAFPPPAEADESVPMEVRDPTSVGSETIERN